MYSNGEGDGGVTVQAVVPGVRLGESGERTLRSCDFVNDCSKRISSRMNNRITE